MCVHACVCEGTLHSSSQSTQESSLRSFFFLEVWPESFNLGSQQTIFLIWFCMCNCVYVSVCLCVSVCLWIYLISDKRIRTTKPRRGSVLLIGALVWEHLWWFQTLMPFVVQRCLSSSAVFLPVRLLQASEKRGPGFTSECLFHFVGRNEIGTEMWLSVLLDMVKDSVGRKSLRGETCFLSATVWTGVSFVGEQWDWFSETRHCWC